jgi:arylsulfatase
MFKNLSQQRLILLSSLIFVMFYNISFFRNVINDYNGLSISNFIYITSLAVVLWLFLVLFFVLLSSKFTTKPLLIIAFLISSTTAYFMDSYNVVIDTQMLQNAIETNTNEALDLFSLKFVIYFILLGVLPSFLIYKAKISYQSHKQEILTKLKYILISLGIILLIILSFSKFYASFFREHKPLRYYTNPSYWIYSAGNFFTKSINKAPNELIQIATDAKIVDQNSSKKIIVMVVGEAARADRFSLNGYEKQTNPLLEKENAISLGNVYSCGTSTAHSVPCMFSFLKRDEYENQKAFYMQNVLDVLNKVGVEILWRDNNSDSKGVALRVAYEDYKKQDRNQICNTECRDEGMIIGLDKFVEDKNDKDVLIILHQMGNHGPAYFKRYPQNYEKFNPVCKSSELEKCTKEEIDNAYDNAIFYTDYFLSSVINFLKQYQDKRQVAMIYMSDHGESLGENGIYLHGMPYLFAPKAQKHIGSILWFGNGQIRNKYDIEKLKSYKDREFSHDNLFHTLLGIFDVQTKIYDEKSDILNDAKISK